VSLLDPAVGSGTFPLAAAQQAIANVAKLLGSGSVRTVLEERVLPNFAGLELMPAPYTIAHVKFALFARDQHVRFKDKRARIYLTNTLGDPLESPALGGMLSLFVGGLVDEAREAERLKNDEPILVIIGNPPWSATSHNKQPQIERLFAAWKTVDGKPINDARIALNDDYLKFLRWAVWKLLKQDHAAGRGIIAFVTNHAFINGRIHRGVRKALLDAFDDIYVFNVQGNRRNAVKAVPDENVFPPVKQGVAMTVLVRRATTSPPAGRVHYREMRGKRAEKYAAATAARLGDSDWRPITPTAPYYSFAADTDDRFAAWPSVPAVFPTSASGVQSSRDDLVADLTAAPIEDRMRLIADPSQSDAELKEQLGIRENQRWSWAEHRSQFKGYRAERTIPWTYRLFDRRLIYWDPVFVEWPRQRLNRHLLPAPFGPGGEDRLALVVQRTGPKPVGAIASVSRGIACAHVTSQWCHVYPLRLAPE
jgi:predicted helicase